MLLTQNDVSSFADAMGRTTWTSSRKDTWETSSIAICQCS